MREVILFIASSLDGFIASPDGGVDWLFSDQDYGYHNFYRSIDTVLMGRKTYARMIRLWGYQYKAKKGFVFTRNRRLKKNRHVDFVSKNIPAFVRGLKKGRGKNIWLVGGGEIAGALFNAGLIDRIVLSIHPVLLRTGIPLFRGLKKPANLALVRSKLYDTGLFQLTYRVKK